MEFDGGGYRMLQFGLDQTASDTIDFHLGESNLPPSPPAGAFDARWILPKNGFNGSLSSWLDYRYASGFPFTETIEHRLKYQGKTGADTMFFKWDFPPEVTGLLQDLIIGTLINVPISGSGVFALTNFGVINQLKLMIYYDAILPVELSSFAASVQGNSVVLNWVTTSEINNLGFEVERASSLPTGQAGSTSPVQGWQKIGFVEGYGTTSEPKQYLFIDENISSGTYRYRLKQIDFDGTFEYSNEVEIDVDFTPKEYTLYQNYPNPFNPTTTIKYSLSFESEVKLIIHNLLGEKIMELVNGIQGAGYYEVNWDAGSIASGIYFYTKEAKAVDTGQNYKAVRKMILLR
jgi:hypothetical protein